MLTQFLKNILTARDNETYSITKVWVSAAAAAMIYRFVTEPTVNYYEFGVGFGVLLAVLVGKYFVEDKEPK